MNIFFLVLATITTVALGAATWTGIHPDPTIGLAGTGLPQDALILHFYLGLVAALATLVTHTWIFFYFIGTGEGIREGVLEHRLDQAAIKRTKKFKGKTFPFALFSMIFVIVTAVLGAGTRVGSVSHSWHLGFALFSFAFNIFSFYQEYHVIQENRHLTKTLDDEIYQLMTKKTSVEQSPTN